MNTTGSDSCTKNVFRGKLSDSSTMLGGADVDLHCTHRQSVVVLLPTDTAHTHHEYLSGADPPPRLGFY
ncbi:hypothetical protein CHARACLAT_001709 [Characodon lateralis]|uniref:Uncharacterized protein n=1 Tax=Characodon lateralis TaxID=208331 RepID=A0ABU7CNS0_9TELE|nr:hypothetical protein [Characodon lateralis]